MTNTEDEQLTPEERAALDQQQKAAEVRHKMAWAVKAYGDMHQHEADLLRDKQMLVQTMALVKKLVALLQQPGVPLPVQQQQALDLLVGVGRL